MREQRVHFLWNIPLEARYNAIHAERSQPCHNLHLQRMLSFDPVVWQWTTHPKAALASAPREEGRTIERVVKDCVVDLQYCGMIKGAHHVSIVV